MKLRKHIGTIMIIFGLLLVVGGIGKVVYHQLYGPVVMKWAGEIGGITPEFREKLLEILPHREYLVMAEDIMTWIPRHIITQSLINLKASGKYFGYTLFIIGLLTIFLGVAIREIINTLEKIMERK